MKLVDRLRNAWKAFNKPIFDIGVEFCASCDRGDEPRVIYICDQKQCRNCSSPMCNHTTNIEHAVNFKKFDENIWVEKVEE